MTRCHCTGTATVETEPRMIHIYMFYFSSFFLSSGWPVSDRKPLLYLYLYNLNQHDPGSVLVYNYNYYTIICNYYYTIHIVYGCVFCLVVYLTTYLVNFKISISIIHLH